MEPIIKIEKLNVTYFLGHTNEARALKDISLEIYPGEFIIFFGPSGCGKSTLLHSVAGLETNIQGNIFVDNKNIAHFKHQELEKFHQRETGMIFQAYYLINSLSCIDNVLLPQIFISAPSEERKKRALLLLEHFGVKQQANKLPSELSGGQQQRVAICRALINDPTILLADEPVGNLDSKSAQDVLELLKELNEKQKKTVILVTHNPAHLDYAHRVFYMRDGGIIDIKVNQAISRDIQPSAMTAGLNIPRGMELLLRTYTSFSPAQVGNLLIPFKAKQIVSEALVGMTSDDIGRIEKRVEDLIIRGIDDNEGMLKFLDIDQGEGGMGLDKRMAKNLMEKIKTPPGPFRERRAHARAVSRCLPASRRGDGASADRRRGHGRDVRGRSRRLGPTWGRRCGCGWRHGREHGRGTRCGCGRECPASDDNQRFPATRRL